MPSPPYAAVQMSVNGGPAQTGGLTVAYADTVQLSGASTDSWTQQRWEIFYYPVGFAAPAGWSTDAEGVYYSTALAPPVITLPSSTTWGKWLFRLRINDALTNDSASEILFDETAGVSIESDNGLRDQGAFEDIQFGTSWLVDHQHNLRVIDANITGGGGGGGSPTGAASGDLGASYPGPSVLKVHGTTVPAGGSLTTGNVLQVSGAAAAIWAAINLAGGAGYVTGNLPITNVAPGSNGQVHVTAGGVSSWATIVDANVSSSAAVAVTKLATGTLGQVLQVKAGPANGWSTDFYVEPLVGTGAPYTGVYVGEGITPSATNHALFSDGSAITSLNVDSASGSLTFCTNNLTRFVVKQGVVRFGSLEAYTLTQTTPASDVATFDLTVSSQAPFATATGSNRNSGGLILSTPAPVAGGTGGSVFIKPAATTALTLSAAGALRLNAYTAGFLKTDSSGNVTASATTGASTIAPGTLGQMFQTGTGPVSQWSTDFYVKPSSLGGTWSGIWVGEGITPTDQNYLIVADGTTGTFISGPSANGYVGVGANAVPIGYFTRTGVGVGLAGFAFSYDVAYSLSHMTQVSNTATFDLTVSSQAPFASATGSNKNPGNLILSVPTPVSGGADGFVKTSIAGTLVMWQGRKIGTSVDTLEVDGSDAAIYLGGNFTPSATNWAVAVPLDGGLYLNAADGNLAGGNRIVFNHNGVNAAVLGSISNTQPGFRFYPTFASPTFGQRTALSDTATFDLTVSSQAPFATATVNKNPGNIVLAVPSPISGGADGFVKVSTSGHANLWFGLIPGVTTFGAIWANNAITPTASNYAFAGNGVATNINAPSGSIFFNVNDVIQATITAAAADTYATPAGFNFYSTVTIPRIGQRPPLSDLATTDLIVQSQGPFATATVNKNPGNIVLTIPAPIAGGTNGFVKTKIGSTVSSYLGLDLSDPTFGDLWLGPAAPSTTNYVLTGDGSTVTWLNSPHATNGIVFSLLNVRRASLTSSGLHFAETAATTIDISTRQSNAATFDLTIASQAPFASATGANRNPGNLVFTVPSPISGGTAGFAKINVSGTQAASFGIYTPVPTYKAMWLGNLTESSSNYAVASDGAALTLNSSNSIVLAKNDDVFVYFQHDFGMLFENDVQGLVGFITQGSDVATQTMTIAGQTPYASATGTNRNSGPVVIQTSAATAGGTAGSIFFKPNATTALTLSAAGLLRLNAYTAGFLTSDSSGNITVTAGGTVAPSGISQGGAAEGQALIWHTSAWTPSTDFSAQNLVTTGFLTTGATTTKIRLGNDGAGFAAIHMGNITPSGSNYAAASDGTDLYLSAATSVNLAVAGNPRLAVTNTQVQILGGALATTAQLIHTQRSGGDVASNDFLVTSQAPSAGATTLGNKAPGNLVLTIPSPISGGASGFVKAKVSGVTSMQVGLFPGFSTFGTIWLGNVTPTDINYTIAADGTDTYFNAGVTAGKFHFVTGTGGGERVQIYVDVATVQNRIETRNGATGVFGAEDRGNDAATDSVIYKSSAPFASATGTNRNSGNVTIRTPAPVSGGTAGTISLQVSATDTLVLNTTTKATWFNAFSLTSGTAAPVAAEVDGSLYVRTGGSNGDLFVRRAAAWVSVFSGAGFVATSRTITAGAGLTGGGDLSADRTIDIVAADGTITVNANSIQVGTVPWGQLSGYVTFTAGAGLTGGGDASASRTFDVVANADGSIVVNANDVQVGVLATDAQHGVRGGGSQHTAVTNAAAGFAPAITAANRVLLSSGGSFSTWGVIVDAMVNDVAWGKLTGTPTTLTGYGITNTLGTTAPLTGGGSLSANLTIAVSNATTGAVGVVQLTGDLGGSASAVDVLKIHGATVPIAGSLVTGAVLRVTGASALGYGAIDLANANAVTGVLPVANHPSLSGDVAGALNATIVSTLTGTTSIVSVAANELRWVAGATITIDQAIAASGSSGSTMTVMAQAGNGTNKNGGRLDIFGGEATGTGLRGGFRLGLGGVPELTASIMVEGVTVATSSRVLALCRGATTTSTQVTSGDRVMYIGECSVVPTTPPVSGCEPFVSGGAWYVMGPSGFITQLSVA